MKLNYDRVLIKNNVKKMLKENWQTVLLVVLLLSAIEIAIELVAMQNQAGGEFLSFIVRMPFDVAICSFLMWMMKNREARTSDFFEPFSRFLKYILAGVWKSLWIFLWTLLLIIPGIVKGYAYAMYPYILAADPDADIVDALRTSKKMTNGYKIDLFTLSLTFLGWYFLLFLVAIGVEMLVIGQNPIELMNEGAFDLLLSKASVIAKIVTIPLSILLNCYVTGVFSQVYELLKTRAVADGVCAPEEFGLTGEQAAVFADEKQIGNMSIRYQSNIENDSDIYYETIEGEILPETDEERKNKEVERGEKE